MKTTKIIEVCGLSLLLFSSCIKTGYDKTWDIVSAGKGEWNIDEMTVCSIDRDTEIQEWDTTCLDAGFFKFYGTVEVAKYDLNAAIPIRSSILGPFVGYEMICSSGDLYLTQNGTGIYQDFISTQILKIDRNELILYCPSSLNSHLDIDNDLSFYFNCSKK